MEQHAGGWRVREGTPGGRVSTTRFNVAIQVIGEFELLAWWPDRKDSGDLVPVDELPAGDPWNAVRAHLAAHRDDQWKLAFRSSTERTVALYTFVDLTIEEIEQVRQGKFSPKSVVDEERAHIEPIVAAIAQQTDGCSSSTENYVRPLRISSRVESSGSKIAAVSSDLGWPEGFKFAIPKIVIAEPEPTRADSPPAILELPFRQRLASATFDDMMRTVRRWGRASNATPLATAP